MRYLHTMVRVKDLGVAMDFYCNALGLVEIRRMDHEAGRFTLVYLAAPQDAERRLQSPATGLPSSERCS